MTSSSTFLFLQFIPLLLLLLPDPGICFGEKQIFLLAGQSNMGGHGGVRGGAWDGYVPPECSPRPEILQLNAELGWEVAIEPLHRDIDNRSGNIDGIGPGMPFSNTVLNSDPEFGVIGLVPAARAGSNISQWQRGGKLYNQLLDRAQAAVFEAADGENIIRGMLWYQGESDTGTYEDAVAYKARLELFFNDIRSDLQLPDLLIIQVALATGVNATFMDIVRKTQLELGMPNVRCVDAIGLEIEPDYPLVHLNTASQVKLGQMLAQAFLQEY